MFSLLSENAGTLAGFSGSVILAYFGSRDKNKGKKCTI